MRIDLTPLLALSVVLLVVPAVAATSTPASASKPVYSTTFISSDNRAGFLVALKNLPVTKGTLMRGVCTSRQNPRDAMVYSAWPSFAALYSQAEGWTSSPDFASLRRVNYVASWAILNEFKPAPVVKTVEHVWRFKVEPKNLGAFVEAVTRFEAGIRTTGAFKDGVTVIGVSPDGGTPEVGSVMVRFVYPNAQQLGATLDAYFAAPSSTVPSLWNDVNSKTDGMLSHSTEDCGPI